MSGLAPWVPVGFKQTEVGVIPKDWDIQTIGTFAEVSSGGTPNREVKEYWNGKIPWVTTTQINGGEIKSSEQFITEKGLISSATKWFKEGTLLMAMYGQGKTRGKISILSIDATINQACAAIQIKKIVTTGFFLHYINSRYEEIRGLSNSGGQENLSGSIIKMIKVPVPLIKEQTAIANALSDVDALITSLEKLITKKRAIKTAAMQQLLTGKKRLPPFDQTHTGYKQTELGEIPGDWEVSLMGTLFELKITRRRLMPNDCVTFVGMQDVSEMAEIIGGHNLRFCEIKSGFTYFERNDVLVAKITPCFENGKGGYADHLPTQVGFGSTEFHVLRAQKNVDSKYLYYLTNTVRFRNELEGEMVGSAGHKRVPIYSIQKYKIAKPSTLKEQSAIANFLTAMDSELNALDRRLNKTQKIKQGMMQELLTGRTRLL